MTAIARYATGMPWLPVMAKPLVAPPAVTVSGAAAAITKITTEAVPRRLRASVLATLLDVAVLLEVRM
ncbi:hypothetical protein Cci01nite_71760 [Catellatospora citrea]|uniref:Uncharacterized protein n=1 Tax=Catellatospora citrea TaxID=53366 RepID=A0A8J3KL94_9ACTN|nr:hypothetical protein Cci01nite_71760 [Catellatospora citrea]